MRRRRWAAGIVAAVLAGVPAGCSGDDTAAVFRRGANDACRRAQTAAARLPDPTSSAEVVVLVAKLLVVTGREAKDFRRLVPPAPQRATLKQLTTLLDDANRRLVAAGAAAGRHDDNGAAAAVEASSSKQHDFARAAAKAGLKTCAKGLTLSGSGSGSSASSSTTTAGAVDDIDLGKTLQPIPGMKYAPLARSARQQLIASIDASPAVKAIVDAVGTTNVTADKSSSVLVFLSLTRVLTDNETKDLVSHVTAGGTNLEHGDIAGKPSWAFRSSDGLQGFLTVRSRTVVIGLSAAPEHLAKVVAGLFQANPTI